MAKNTLELVIKAQDYASKELKKINKQVKGISKTMKKAWKDVKAFWEKNKKVFKQIWIGAGIAITAIWFMGKKFLNLWTQIEQTQKKSKIVFWEYIWDIQKVAKETAKSMWLSQNEYLNAAAWIQDLLIPMWFLRWEATKMTTDMVWLAGALSEWSAGQYNADEVSRILAKAMLWETEQLKSLWIQVDISSKQFNERIKTLAEEKDMTLQQAKALDIQRQIFEKSTDAQEAYKTGWDSLVRQQAILTATMKDARDSIAIALIPAMNQLIKTMAPVIEDVSKSIKLWAENKQNIDDLKDSMISAIEVFKTIWKIIWSVIWFLQKMWEMFGTVAVAIVIFIWNFTGAYDTFDGATKTIIENVKAGWNLLFGWLETKINAFKRIIKWLKTAYNTVKKALWFGWGGSWVDWALADWWPVSAGKTYLVWERWPELFSPKSSGSITSNEDLRWWGWDININMWWVTVNNEADEDRLVEKIKMSLTNSLQMNKFWIS